MPSFFLIHGLEETSRSFALDKALLGDITLDPGESSLKKGVKVSLGRNGAPPFRTERQAKAPPVSFIALEKASKMLFEKGQKSEPTISFQASGLARKRSLEAGLASTKNRKSKNANSIF